MIAPESSASLFNCCAIIYAAGAIGLPVTSTPNPNCCPRTPVKIKIPPLSAGKIHIFKQADKAAIPRSPRDFRNEKQAPTAQYVLKEAKYLQQSQQPYH